MEQLFARWLELQSQRKSLDPMSSEHIIASARQYLIEDELRHDYGKLLFWNRESKQWQVVDAE